MIAGHMTDTVQWTTLLIAAAVIAGVFVGVRSLWDSWRDQWAIDDLTEWLLMDRDQHASCDRAAMQAARSSR